MMHIFRNLKISHLLFKLLIVISATSFARSSKNNSRDVEQKVGGFSDGGGNCVRNPSGCPFLDYYENQGTTEIKQQDIIKVVSERLRKLESLIPIFDIYGEDYEVGLGKNLEKMILSKKWYWEPKQINSQACLNESFVQTAKQFIVGCQNNFEVRLYGPWLRKASLQDQEGLILHEAFLAWARENDKQSSKSDLEFKVRVMNRAFLEIQDSEMLKAEFTRLYPGLKVYSNQDQQQLLDIPPIEKKSKQEFCEGLALSYLPQILQMKNSELLYEKAKASFDVILEMQAKWKVIASKKKIGANTSDDEKSWLRERGNYCSEASTQDPLILVKLNPSKLSQSCRKEIEDAAKKHFNIQNFGLTNQKDNESLLRGCDDLAMFAALSCSAIAGGSEERKKQIQMQALKYYQELK